MSDGFIAYNDNNEVLISSDSRNLHFIQKKTTPTSTVFSLSRYGGMRKWIYSITNVSVTPVPFMYMPTEDFYAVDRIENKGGGNWDIEVIRSGTSSSTPDLYIFGDPRASTSTDSYGMMVYQDDGTAAFDSRLRPLAITGGLSVSHPSNPRPSIDSSNVSAKNCATTMRSHFAPNQFNTQVVSSQPTKAIFCFLSLAQAERQFTVSASETVCDGVSVYGNCVGIRRDYDWTSTYWAFYRGGIRWTGSVIEAGWITVEKGCNWTYDVDSYFVGIGTGGDTGTGGNWPYSNETINTSAVSVIIADGARYD